MTEIHDFGERLAEGQVAECAVLRFLKELDEYQGLELAYSPRVQSSGIDIIGYLRGQRVTFEVKRDARLADTGSAFIETISNDVRGNAGWALTCEADWLLHYSPAECLLRWIRPVELKAAVENWLETAPGGVATRSVDNRGYRTIGLLVPLDLLSPLVKRLDTVNEPHPCGCGPPK